MNRKVNVTKINVLANAIFQITSIISGLIIPQLILKTFGSEVNGLISSITQMLSYINLLEGGITGVITASLYKPLVEKDDLLLSQIIKTAQGFFKKIALFFIIYVAILSVTYKIFFDVSFSFSYVCSLIVISAITIFMQYNFSISWKLLLNADKKVYIVAGIQSILTILNIVFFAIGIKVFPNIHLLKLMTAIIFILQPIIYSKIVNKNYNIEKNVEENIDILKSRWDGIAITIASIIHNNTDVVILSFFTNLKIVSVYSVYRTIVNGIRSIIISVSSAILPTVGQKYVQKDIKKLNETFSKYEFIIYFLTFFVFSVASLLLIPFVMLYTKDVTDVNYYQPVFGIIMLLAEAMYCLRDPYIGIAYSAKKFLETKKYAYIEAVINIVGSLILVKPFGIIGVAFATLLSMIYRTIAHNVFLKNNILYRKTTKSIKLFFVFLIVSSIGIILCFNLYKFVEYTLIEWLLHAIIYSIIILILYILVLPIFFKREIFNFIKTLKKREE